MGHLGRPCGQYPTESNSSHFAKKATDGSFLRSKDVAASHWPRGKPAMHLKKISSGAEPLRKLTSSRTVVAKAPVHHYCCCCADRSIDRVAIDQVGDPLDQTDQAETLWVRKKAQSKCSKCFASCLLVKRVFVLSNSFSVVAFGSGAPSG